MNPRLKSILFWGFIAAMAVLSYLLAGCAPTLTEDRHPAPSSSLTHADALALAAAWAAQGEGRDYGTVSNTGSMLPLIDSRSVLLSEPVAPADLRLGDVVIYARGRLVAHRVEHLQPDGWILTRGLSNDRADELVHPSQIRARVVAILYTQR